MFRRGYNKFVRDTFGKKKLVDVKFSDVLQFYLHLVNVEGLALGTLDNVHCVLHPTFELAVRDDIIRKNPTDGVKKEISKSPVRTEESVRHLQWNSRESLWSTLRDIRFIITGGHYLQCYLEPVAESEKI